MRVQMLPSANGDISQHYANLNLYSRKKNWTYESVLDMAGCWWEIDEMIYYHFMEILPPVYRPYGFSMSERLSGDIAAYFFKTDNKYYCAYVDFSQQNAASIAFEWPQHFFNINQFAELAQRYADLARFNRDCIAISKAKTYMNAAEEMARKAMNSRLQLIG